MVVYWGIPLAILVGYFIRLPGAMAAGIPPLEFFSIHLSQISVALTPYSIPLLAILTFYLYVHVVLIPLAISAAHGDARTHRGLHAVASLLIDASLFLRAWWCGLDTERTRPIRRSHDQPPPAVHAGRTAQSPLQRMVARHPSPGRIRLALSSTPPGGLTRTRSKSSGESATVSHFRYLTRSPPVR